MPSYRGWVIMLMASVAGLPLPGWSQIEEIVVTTRKKEEKLQEVPIAVTAITEDVIARQGISDLNDVVKLSPSVQFDRSFGPADTRVTIRGLSNQRGRSNVAFLVDGIDVTTENLVSAGSGLLANRRLLTDIESVELVKGPQSALYGRAAFAGAISYTTKEPGEEWEGKTNLDLAEDGLYQVDGAFGGPITDTLGTRLTGFFFTQDGHYVNSMSGDDVGGASGSGFAWTSVYRPNDVTKIKFRTEYSEEDYDPLPNVRVGGGWQGGPTIGLAQYPRAVITQAERQLLLPTQPNSAGNDYRFNGLGYARNNNSTGLLDFGQYCPENRRYTNPSLRPGMCLPKSYGSADGRVVAHSEDPLTNEDFDGSDLETFRASLVATFDLEAATLTSYTGWTDFDSEDKYDQDWQAASSYTYRWSGAPSIPIPTLPGGRQPDQLLAGQVARTEGETDQFSQELRLATKLDGPLNYTFGALWWTDRRTLVDRNAIVMCLPVSKGGSWQGVDALPAFGYEPGLCDGGPFGGTSGPLTTVGWQQYYRQLQDGGLQIPGIWDADTEHWSFYASIDWNIADEWTLTLEDRLVSEKFALQKPNQSTCTNFASALTTGTFFRLETDPTTGFNAVCPWDEIVEPDLNDPQDPNDSFKNDGVINASDNLRIIKGTERSHYHTPKVTLRWEVTPDNMLYTYWAHAQKPGGINQLAAGGSAVSLINERFLPEKLDAYEIGTKNTFPFFGSLQFNAAGFLQDYTDKQVNTQVIVDGVSQPRVLNASGAEVWGLELDLLWQPEAIEGLLIGLSYTYLDAEYEEFIDDVTSVQRLAAINRPCQLVYKNNANEVVFGPGGRPFNQAEFEANRALPDQITVNGQPRANPDKISAVACQVDLKGKQLERSPEHAFLGTINYTRPLLDNGVDLLAQLDAQYQDSRFLDQDNYTKFEDYWIANVRLGLTSPKWEVVGYVDNVFDDDTIKSGGSGPDFARQASELGFTAGLGTSHFFGTLPDPRIVGVRMSYRFGAGL
jgi:outer membrane receptor protein involved in Fe transport